MMTAEGLRDVNRSSVPKVNPGGLSDPQLDQLEALNRWADWAKLEIEKLQEQLGTVAFQKNQALKELDQQEAIAKGLEAQLEVRKSRSVETYELGSWVKLLGPETTVRASVERVAIDRAGVRYLVRYWLAGNRRREWVSAGELEPVEDLLTPPKLDFSQEKG